MAINFNGEVIKMIGRNGRYFAVCKYDCADNPSGKRTLKYEVSKEDYDEWGKRVLAYHPKNIPMRVAIEGKLEFKVKDLE